MKKVSLIISTFFGTGYFPKMPGTIGTLAAAVIYVMLPESFFVSMGNIYTLLVIMLLALISIPFINESEKILGHDSGKIVIDEVAGYMISVLFLPKSLTTAIIAFVFFRIFDIFKIEPVNKLQSLPGGWGVMADDIMAGIYSNICCQLIFRLILS